MDETRAGALTQTKVYLGRCWRGFVNDHGWKSFVSVALITIIIGLVMGDETFVGYADTKNGGFALVCACIWIGIFNSIRTVCRERDIVRRERRTGLLISSYILAHWLYEAVLCAAEALLVCVLVRVMSWDHFIEKAVFLPPMLELYVTFFLIVFSADALGLLISSVVADENTAMTVMPFALIIQLVMSGTIFELEGVASLISNLTISKWGLGAICASSRVNETLEVMVGYVEELPEYASTVANLLSLWGILLLFAVAYGVLSVIALQALDK